MKRMLVVILGFAIVAGWTSAAAPAYTQPPAGSYTTSVHQLKVGDAVIPVQGAAVTPAFFVAANVRPYLGRFFIDQDTASPKTRVVVLSRELWVERFGSSATIIGQVITLDGQPATVVGLAPRGFAIPAGARLWMPRATTGQ